MKRESYLRGGQACVQMHGQEGEFHVARRAVSWGYDIRKLAGIPLLHFLKKN